MKRLISLIAALAVFISIINITVFAIDEGGKEGGGGGSGGNRSTYSNILHNFAETVANYANGSISYDEFASKASELSGQLSSLGASDALGVLNSDFIDNLVYEVNKAISEYGLRAPEMIDKWLSDFFNDYKSLENTSTSDLKGGMSAAMVPGSHDGEENWYYCSTASYLRNNGTSIYMPAVFLEEYIYGSRKSSYDMDTSVARSYGTNGNGLVYGKKIILLGTWLRDDGTLADTDDVYTENEVFNFDDLPDDEIEDILKKVLEKLENEQPDLSNLEGLLKAIYNRLGTLDSDDDNDILTQINASIIALAKDGNPENSDLLETLQKLKEAFVNGDDESYIKEIAEDVNDISKTLKGLMLIEVAEDLLDLSDSEKKLFNAYADLIPLLINKIGFAAVSQVMTDMQVIMFTETTPSDLTVNIFGEGYILLSSSMFTDESIKYIKMGKTFVSLVLVYVWCMKMRKRLAGE